MKAKIVLTEGFQTGTPLKDVEYGTVVRRMESDIPYLVVSPMDGTGHKALVTLGGGTLKRVPQDTPVFMLEATFTVASKQKKAEPVKPQAFARADFEGLESRINIWVEESGRFDANVWNGKVFDLKTPSFKPGHVPTITEMMQAAAAAEAAQRQKEYQEVAAKMAAQGYCQHPFYLAAVRLEPGWGARTPVYARQTTSQGKAHHYRTCLADRIRVRKEVYDLLPTSWEGPTEYLPL